MYLIYYQSLLLTTLSTTDLALCTPNNTDIVLIIRGVAAYCNNLNNIEYILVYCICLL